MSKATTTAMPSVCLQNSSGDELYRIIEQTPDAMLDDGIVCPGDPAFTNLRRHFSPLRTAMLETIPLKRHFRVLELGAESGICTRYLALRCAHVTALEPATMLAEAARQRCRDLDNVEILTITPAGFTTPETFDLVVMTIDPLCETGASGHTMQALSTALCMIGSAGMLVLSIDTGKGLSSVISAGTTEGFDSLVNNAVNLALFAEVLGVVKEAQGIAGPALFPFPNALMPRGIFTDAAIRACCAEYGQWAMSSVIGDSNREAPIALTNAVVKATREGKLSALSGSFCVFVSRRAESLPDFSWECRAYSSETRNPRFRTTTHAVRRNDAVQVIKHGQRFSNGCFLFDPCSTVPLYQGHTVKTSLLLLLEAGLIDRFFTVLRLFEAALVDQFKWLLPPGVVYPSLTDKKDTLLRGAALDVIPQNAVLSETGFGFFDLEWQTSIPLPLSYVVFRGLLNTLARCSVKGIFAHLGIENSGGKSSVPDCIMLIYNMAHPDNRLNPLAVNHMFSFEKRFMEFVRTGCVHTDGASLYEAYHQAILAHSTGQVTGEIEFLKASFPNNLHVRAFLQSVDSKGSGDAG